MKKNSFITILIIIAVIVLSYFLIRGSPQNTDAHTAKCIGENSVLYVQIGCHACENQEEMFGDSAQYLNIIDCFYEREKCGEIEATPTWLINGEYYKGVQTIDKLKELTGC